MNEHTPQWKRGFAQAMAGVLWNEQEHPDWKEGHCKAVVGMMFRKLPDKHGLLLRQRENGTQAQEDAFLAKRFPAVAI